MDRNRYQATRKQVLRDNRIILGDRGAFWLFWIPVALAVAMLGGALWWLLTHSAPVVAGLAM
jgi:hypothetical protein